MKRILLIAVMLLLSLTLIVACKKKADSVTPPTEPEDGEVQSPVNPEDGEVRTTITEDEWNKTLGMNNFTMVWDVFEFSVPIKATEDALEFGGDELRYYVNEGGAFYYVYNVDGHWCKNPDVAGDETFSTFAKRFNVVCGYEELVYDATEKAYIQSIVLDGDEVSLAYSFEDGLLTKIKIFDEFESWYYISNIGTTVVTVPEYITSSIYYGLAVMPDGGGFERMDVSAYELPDSIKEVHKATNGGYVFVVEFEGYRPGNVAVIGVDGNGNITGTKITQDNDTGNIFDLYDTEGRFNGVNVHTVDGVDIFAGATMSTSAYRRAVKEALGAASVLRGICNHDLSNTTVIPGVDPTCLGTGLSDGLMYSCCGRVVVPQTVLPVIDCIESDWIIDDNVTHESGGVRHTECTTCGYVFKTERVSSVNGYCRFVLGECVICGQEAVSGLYNKNNEMIASWSELTEVYGLDITAEYTGYDDDPNGYKNSHTSGFYVLTHYDELRGGTMLIIDDSIECIGQGALHFCESLEYIYIPKSVTSISMAALHTCTNLKNIIFEGTVEEWNEVFKGFIWNTYTPATEVICSDGVVQIG